MGALEGKSGLPCWHRVLEGDTMADANPVEDACYFCGEVVDEEFGQGEEEAVHVAPWTPGAYHPDQLSEEFELAHKGCAVNDQRADQEFWATMAVDAELDEYLDRNSVNTGLRGLI